MPGLVLVLLLVPMVALHSSLQHEIIHGHPTQSDSFNVILAFPALGLVVPYERYEILHLQHHRNWLLTDPYDDSESYFLCANQWANCSALQKRLLKLNNTLAGRLTIGPAIMIIRMMRSEFLEMKTHQHVRLSWLKHIVGTLMVFSWLAWQGFSIWFYCALIAYPALSLLMLRSFSEHLPEEVIDHRSAIICSNKFMQLLYLNNNFHRVHHDYPEAPWYQLPQLYRDHYRHHTTHVYAGYSELFKRFFMSPRFPVQHPFLYTEAFQTNEELLANNEHLANKNKP